MRYGVWDSFTHELLVPYVRVVDNIGTICIERRSLQEEFMILSFIFLLLLNNRSDFNTFMYLQKTVFQVKDINDIRKVEKLFVYGRIVLITQCNYIINLGSLTYDSFHIIVTIIVT